MSVFKVGKYRCYSSEQNTWVELAGNQHPAYPVFDATQPIEDYGSVSTLHVKETLCSSIYGGSTYEQGACQSPCSATSALWKLYISAQILHGAADARTQPTPSNRLLCCARSRTRPWQQQKGLEAGLRTTPARAPATSAIMPCHASSATDKLTLEDDLTL